MAAKKADEQKKVYTYRARPSIVKKANAKAKRDKTTLSNKIETLISEYSKRKIDEFLKDVVQV